jgi:hypothetical protein
MASDQIRARLDELAAYLVWTFFDPDDPSEYGIESNSAELRAYTRTRRDVHNHDGQSPLKDMAVIHLNVEPLRRLILLRADTTKEGRAERAITRFVLANTVGLQPRCGGGGEYRGYFYRVPMKLTLELKLTTF